jgi:hypothetical protein
MRVRAAPDLRSPDTLISNLERGGAAPDDRLKESRDAQIESKYILAKI